jgi:hypothetical protein
MRHSRYNPFNMIHKGLRALLYETALKIQRTDFACDQEVHDTFEQVRTALWIFKGHIRIEKEEVYAKLYKLVPFMVQALEKEHEKHEKINQELLYAMEGYWNAKTLPSKISAGQNILMVFNEFVSFHLLHMNRQETVVNDLLWENYSDIQLIRIVRSIAEKIPTKRNEQYNRWILKGLALHEVIVWLKTIRFGSTAVVYERFYTMAEAELPADLWMQVEKALYPRRREVKVA